MNKVNFLDIIEISSNKIKNNNENKLIIGEYNKYVSFLFAEVKLLYDYNKNVNNLYSEKKEFIKTKLLPNINEKLKNLRILFYKKNGAIPSTFTSYSFSYNNELVSTPCELSLISKLPLIKGSEVISLVDKFSFALMPYDYIVDNPFMNENMDRRRLLNKSIDIFKNNLSDTHNFYVIAPLEYFSIEKTVSNYKLGLDIYGGVHKQTFQSLVMSLPILKNMKKDIETLKNNGVNINNSIDEIKNSMLIMDSNIKTLSKQVQEQNEKMIELNLKLEKRIEVMEQIREEKLLSFDDPMFIAIKNDVNVNLNSFSTTDCIIGGIWGNDFTEEIINVLDLTTKVGQRKKLNKIFGYN